MIQSSIFKSYDVRGTYPDQLNEHTAFQIGKGFIRYAQVKNVAVGHDARLSSPELFRALVEGIISQGANVFSIGQVPTECLYFAVGSYPDIDGGVMVTASHNPKEYNGFKMLKKDSGDIAVIRGTDLATVVSADETEAGRGKSQERDIWPDYLNYVAGFIKSDIKPLNVVIDASNGVMGKAIEGIKGKLPISISELNFGPDGNFPNHSPNPLEAGSSYQIADRIKDENADFGIMFDGDADRIFLVDEAGLLVPADITLLLLAKHLLGVNPGSVVAYNAVCSRAVPEWIETWGGKPVRTKVGFVNVREGLIKNNGIMGGELSAHYSFRDYFYMDSGMIAMLLLLQIISADGRKVSEMIHELQKYCKAAEDFEISDKEAVLEKVKRAYADGKQDFLDGVTVDFGSWWFNIRPSNTEPLLKLTVEAGTPELLDQKKEELSKLIIESGLP